MARRFLAGVAAAVWSVCATAQPELSADQAGVLADSVLREPDRTFMLRARVTEIARQDVDPAEVERSVREVNPMPLATRLSPALRAVYEDRIHVDVEERLRLLNGETNLVHEIRSNGSVARIDTWDLSGLVPADLDGEPSHAEIFEEQGDRSVRTTSIDYRDRLAMPGGPGRSPPFPIWLLLGPEPRHLTEILRAVLAYDRGSTPLQYVPAEGDRERLIGILRGTSPSKVGWVSRLGRADGKPVIEVVHVPNGTPFLEVVFADDSLRTYTRSTSRQARTGDVMFDITIEQSDESGVPTVYSVRTVSQSGVRERTYRVTVESVDMNAEPSVEEMRRIPEGFARIGDSADR